MSQPIKVDFLNCDNIFLVACCAESPHYLYIDSLNPKGHVSSFKTLELSAAQSLASNLTNGSKIRKSGLVPNYCKPHNPSNYWWTWEIFQVTVTNMKSIHSKIQFRKVMPLKSASLPIPLLHLPGVNHLAKLPVVHLLIPTGIKLRESNLNLGK